MDIKEYKNSLCSFVIKKDKKDWQSDYLQGSYLIKKSEYFLAGELDYRFPGEEEEIYMLDYIKMEEKFGIMII